MKALDEIRKYEDLVYAAARARIVFRDTKTASKLVRQAIALRPNDALAYFEAMRISVGRLNSLDISKCVTLISRCHNPNQYWINVSKGLLLETQNRNEEAVAYYQKALACNDATDNQFRAFLFMGNMQCEEEQHEESLQNYRNAYSRQQELPNCQNYLLATCMFNMADVYANMQDQDRCMEAIDMAIACCPEYIEMVLEKSIFMRDVEKAKELCWRVINGTTVKPILCEAYLHLVTLTLQSVDFEVDEVIHYCRLAIQCDPKYYEPYFRLLEVTNDDQESVYCAKRIIELCQLESEYFNTILKRLAKLVAQYTQDETEKPRYRLFAKSVKHGVISRIS